MSEFTEFRGGNTNSLREEFKERAKFAEFELPDGTNFIDTVYENFNYGVLNSNFEPVTIITDSQFSNMIDFEEDANYVRALPFLFRAFTKFREDYQETLNNSTLELPKYFSSLAPEVGYVSFDSEYESYMDFLLQSYHEQLKGNIRITDFNSFFEEMKNIVSTTSIDFPITRSGFAMSRYCSIMTTGLCLELQVLDYNRDTIKGEMIQGREYECFADYANHYGLAVDKNVPWRLIADLESPMIKQELVFGKDIEISEAQKYFDSVYRVKTHIDDVYSIRDFVIVLYYQLITGQDIRQGASLAPDMTLIPSSGTITEEVINVSAQNLLELNLLARYTELGIDRGKYQESLNEVLDLYEIYGSIRICSDAIGKLSSNRIREIYEN